MSVGSVSRPRGVAADCGVAAPVCKPEPEPLEQDLPPTCEAEARPPVAAEAPARKSSATDRLDPDSLPDIGSEFLGFEILSQIGAGAFAKVFLARQRSLGDRLVVLKITTESAGEARVLSQLLHTNVVPIYSVHYAAGLSVVCMPFLGTTTLADVLREVRSRGLPESGKYLVHTLQEHRSTRASSARRSSQTGSSYSNPGSAGAPPAEDELGLVPEQKPGTRVLLEKLEGLSYVDAILWLAQRLADGLAHAHERGILHRDLKPANILLTDEGQPMLLDFNLAEDTKIRASAEAARLGGTLPYMSPEQFAAFQGSRQPLDPRSDIYSLGVILYELLSGQFPFPTHVGPTRDVLGKMSDDRRRPPVPLYRWNTCVTPAVDAIVRRCLAPDPRDRYQSVRALQEDIRRQRAHLPLLHAREPSWRERGRKWLKRHPRLASLTTALAATLLISSVLGGLAVYRGQRLRQYEAVATFQRFEEELNGAQFHLAQAVTDPQRRADVSARARQALELYPLLDNPNWREEAAVRCLPGAQQDKLEEGLRTLLLLLARVTALEAADLPPGQERTAALEAALRLNDRARGAAAETRSARAWWSQRAQLLALLGRKDEADRCLAKAVEQPVVTAQDAFLAAREFLVDGQVRQALPLLEEATGLDPQHVHAWFLLARCYDSIGQPKDAIACYTTCIALQPKEPQPYLQRGVAYLRQHDYGRARADFDRVVALQPRNCDAYFNRALALKGLKRAKEAIADLDRALELNAPYTRVYFLRARLQEEAGDLAAAQKDRAEGLEREPADEQSWNARGFARLASDPDGALADFHKALALNPRSLAALENCAHVWNDVRKKPREALPFLDKAIAFHPDFLPARLARALLRARLGERAAALKDLQAALERSTTPQTHFRAAAILSQTSQQNPGDAQEALRHLSAALRQGYGHALVERDPDLALLRHHPEFRKVLEAARTLR